MEHWWQPLPVLATMVVGIGIFVLAVHTIGQRPAAVRTFYQPGKYLRCAVLLPSAPVANLLLYLTEHISEIIASWVFSTRYHSSFGLRTFFLFLNEMLSAYCGRCVRYRFPLSEYFSPALSSTHRLFLRRSGIDIAKVPYLWKFSQPGVGTFSSTKIRVMLAAPRP